MYTAMWSTFTKYWIKCQLCPTLPVLLFQLVNYLANLFDQIYAPSTITSHASAISFIHSLFGYTDPTKSFWIKNFLKGISKLSSIPDSRLPFTQHLLHQLINGISAVISVFSHQLMLKAIFLLAFYGFL